MEMLDSIIAEAGRYGRFRSVGELHDRPAMRDALEKIFEIGDAALNGEIQQRHAGDDAVVLHVVLVAERLVEVEAVTLDHVNIRIVSAQMANEIGGVLDDVKVGWLHAAAENRLGDD